MLLDRRVVLTGTAAMLFTHWARARSVEERGLFWSLAPQGVPKSILFGYARTAASAVPAVVADGQRFAAQCAGVIGDVPNVQLPSLSVDRTRLTPLFDRIPADLAKQIRTLLNERFPSLAGNDKITGLEFATLLGSEGQTPPAPSVGSAIAQSAQSAGKPLGHLLTPQEYAAEYHAPDLVAVDQRVTEETIRYLLGLRAAVGPIGKCNEILYASRQIAELSKLADEMRSHGVISFADLSGLPIDRLKDLIADRAIKASQTAKAPLFLMLPIGILDESGGVIEKARSAGAFVSLLA